MKNPLAFLLFAGATAMPLSASAMNILLSNDDGLSANAKALKSALEAAGHNVVMSVPCQNQSGKGAAINFLTPIVPLAKACVGGAASAGAPGLGPISGLNDAYYVDGTPIMALMYGLDVVAPQRWSGAPDLIISGPNEGQNLGSIVISSGTVSNAQFALTRGIPAIAVSADINTTKNDALAAEVAVLTVQLVEKLDSRRPGKPPLPKGYALNVNYPKFELGQSSTLPWTVTRFGNFDSMDVHFVADLSTDPIAASYGLGNVHLPGVAVSVHTADEANPTTDRKSEALKSLQGYITLTPMENGYQVSSMEAIQLTAYLKKALKAK